MIPRLCGKDRCWGREGHDGPCEDPSMLPLKYTHYSAIDAGWLGMPRNKYGFESIFDDPENRQHIRKAIGAPAPQIPYLFWPLAIVGALVFAHVVNGMCKK